MPIIKTANGPRGAELVLLPHSLPPTRRRAMIVDALFGERRNREINSGVSRRIYTTLPGRRSQMPTKGPASFWETRIICGLQSSHPSEWLIASRGPLCGPYLGEGIIPVNPLLGRQRATRECRHFRPVTETLRAALGELPLIITSTGR